MSWWWVAIAVLTILTLVVMNMLLWRGWDKTTDQLTEVTQALKDVNDSYAEAVEGWGVCQGQLVNALNVALAARELLVYTDRSAESFYGNTAKPTIQEQALARTFEVERNNAITALRRALKEL